MHTLVRKRIISTRRFLRTTDLLLIFCSLAKWSKRLSQHKCTTTFKLTNRCQLHSLHIGNTTLRKQPCYVWQTTFLLSYSNNWLSPRCSISLTRFISGLWYYWSYDLGGKTWVLLWFLKIDTVLVEILPWKRSAINNHWRSSVHSLCPASWCPTRVYTWTITFHPVYRPSSRCNCSP